MTIPWRAVLRLSRIACASLAFVLAASPCRGEESGDAAPAGGEGSSSRRSHIQPVAELAAASRNADALGMRLTRAPEVLRRQLKLARGAGLVVEEVLPGSVAERSGLREHDVLVLLDDQVLLLPEQLTALLDAASGAAPACTLLREGGRVTLPLGTSAPTQTVAGSSAPPRGPGAVTFAPSAASPTRQTSAKPSTAPQLKTPASTLALVQPAPANPRPTQPSGAPSSPSPAVSGRTVDPSDEVLLREDDDYTIKLSQGRERRLIVVARDGRIVFNDEIDSPERRGLVPAVVRERVREMERSLEPARRAPSLDVGRLQVSPVEIR